MDAKARCARVIVSLRSRRLGIAAEQARLGLSVREGEALLISATSRLSSSQRRRAELVASYKVQSEQTFSDRRNAMLELKAFDVVSQAQFNEKELLLQKVTQLSAEHALLGQRQSALKRAEQSAVVREKRVATYASQVRDAVELSESLERSVARHEGI